MYLAFHLNNYKDKLDEALLNLKAALANESEQTKEMLQIYLRKSMGEKVSATELSRAHQQFRDVFRGAGLGVLLFLPFSPITLPFIVKLGDKLGVNILPDSFREIIKPKQKN
ncbi:MAG: hypothetical protein H6625_13105 [Bdellovibrionaceae bacterium]|nr:hypothetical protein [Pseudobdellovibrionaceae bacterium]